MKKNSEKKEEFMRKIFKRCMKEWKTTIVKL